MSNQQIRRLESEGFLKKAAVAGTVGYLALSVVHLRRSHHRRRRESGGADPRHLRRT